MEQEGQQIRFPRVGESSRKVTVTEFKRDLATRDAHDGTSDDAAPQCANCNTPTSKRCGRCSSDDPATEYVNSKPTFYCSRECQTHHWKEHKRRCAIAKHLLNREALTKVVDFLQLLFYMYRKNAFDLRMHHIIHDQNILEIWEREPKEHEIFVNFPQNRIKDLEIPEEQFLTLMTFTEMMCQFHVLCVLLMTESQLLTDNQIEEVHFTIKPTPQSWRFHGLQNRYTSDGAPHCVWRVTLDGTQWAIDLGGAQYGYTQPLMMWTAYEQERIAQVSGVYSFGGTFAYQWNRYTANEGEPDSSKATARIKYMSQIFVSRNMRENLLLSLEHAKVSVREILCNTSRSGYAAVRQTLLACVDGKAIIIPE